MKKRIIFKLLFLTVLFSLVIVNVYAVINSDEQTRSTSYASALGATNINISDSALTTILNDAVSTYNDCGYVANSKKDPSALVILSNAISSKVQLYFAHGYASSDRIIFPNGGLINIEGGATISGNTYYGLDMVDWTTKKLVTVSTCYSAGSEVVQYLDSFAAEICRLGCEMTVGWYTAIPGFYGPEWLGRYHDKLRIGDNVLDAILYANEMNEPIVADYGSYKNVKVFSHTGSTTSIIENNSRQNLSGGKNNLIVTLANDKVYTKKELEKCLEKIDLNFDINNYHIVEKEGVYVCNIETGIEKKVAGYIDANVKVGDFITNLGYTVVLDEKDNIKAVYDYGVKNAIERNVINNDSKDFVINRSIKENFIKKAKDNHLNEKIIKEDIMFFYNVDENRKEVIVLLKIQDKDLNVYNKTYTYEI